ncbi:MAG: AraC family transcriptional regulator [Lachnospiraceae bacterium]|jgi:AraC-like DNA-binding protein
MAYQGLRLSGAIQVQKLYSLHYFEYRSDFVFEGETHDFWEFLCVDKGDVIVRAGKRSLRLSAGDVIFHAPGEFHAVKADGVTAPNLLVLSFSTRSRDMEFFRERQLHIDAAERAILAALIQEGRDCFGERLDNPWLQTLTPRKERRWGCEQMIRIKLEEFLLHIRRRYAVETKVPAMSENPREEESFSTVAQNSDRRQLRQIEEYMKAGVSRKLTLETICRDNMISRSKLQQLFRVYEGSGVMEYFIRLKTETAGEMIRTGGVNFTQIADFLGYSSVHYFSRQFKKETGMTPSEYASSIKALMRPPASS